MDVNIGLSRLDPISDLSSKPGKSPVDAVTFQQEVPWLLVSRNENMESAVQSAAWTKSLDATRGLLTATVQDGGGRGQIPLYVTEHLDCTL